jgi:hypothetical protein
VIFIAEKTVVLSKQFFDFFDGVDSCTAKALIIKVHENRRYITCDENGTEECNNKFMKEGFK